MMFNSQVLSIDLEAKAAELSGKLSKAVLHVLRRRGLVVAISGGIDSACTAALAVRALGPRRVHGLLLPERDSQALSTRLGRELCEKLDIPYSVHDIAPMLEAAGCYSLRDEAVRSVCPDFQSGWPWNIVLGSDRSGASRLNVFYLVVRRPDGDEQRVRLTPQAYLQIVAATNFKQRARKMMEYYHADRLVYATSGTPNRLEYDQGFFVKLGDGAADVKPIAGLYKTQVYALAAHLGVIDGILRREPTTDTYSLEQSQEDFYFSLHYSQLDLILWAKNHDIPVAEVSRQLGLDMQLIQHAYNDIDQKRKSTAYLHAQPILLEPVNEIEAFRPRLDVQIRNSVGVAA
ncbi:NAD(+) synthase [Nevskia soli]|uniref:NAD(+) synthase n=1 Tax=Nevskia soli TaxID=418856 RepID=UPI000AE956FD|nr:NAD(+) synthase [Nevskia soli]